MNIITGYTGTPHITSLQDRAGHQGAYGTGSYVLNVGNKLTATAASANEIRVADGCISHQGCLAIIEPGTYDSVEIANGTQGMNRNDLIVARYTKNAETNVESMALVVIQGEPTSGTASDPSYTSGNIQSGATTADMPLYRVALSGVTIESVTALFTIVKTQAETDEEISTINSSLSKTTGSGSASNAFGAITYQWAMRGNIATVYVEYVPSGNITSSSGALLLSGIPAPSVKVYSATKDLGSHPTVCAPADLATNKNCYFYGARTAEHTYTASFTYVVN